MINSYLLTAASLGMVGDRFAELRHAIATSNPWLQVVLTIGLLLIMQAILHSTIDRIVEQTVRHHKHASQVEELKRETTLKNVFRTTSTIILWLVGFVVILWELQVRIGPLLTGAGVLGVVAGLGAQSLIKDTLAGIFIIIENQMRVGDIVTIATPTATVSGMVEEVAIRTTRLRDLDGNLHIMTNGSIGVITNQSFQFAQVNIDIFLTYDTDIDLVEKLIAEAGRDSAKASKIKEDIIEPIAFLRVDNLGENNVTVKALGKVKPGSQWEVAGDFRRHLKLLFDKHKIAAPYPNIMVREPKKRS